MKVIAFIEPPQGEVIEKILRHCGLWHPSAPRGRRPLGMVWSTTRMALRTVRRRLPTSVRELTYVDIDTFLATF